jgi:hypothetical protein
VNGVEPLVRQRMQGVCRQAGASSRATAWRLLRPTRSGGIGVAGERPGGVAPAPARGAS